MNEVLQGKLTITLDSPLRIFALIEGGWLLPAVVAPFCFLLDSNAFNYLVRIARGTDDCSVQERQHWQQILALEATLLNPLPRALEGSTGLWSPTTEEFRLRFTESVATLKSLCTRSQVVEYTEPDYEAVNELVESVAGDTAADNQFLLDIAPYLVNQPPAVACAAVEEQIFDRAGENGVSGSSLAFLASLSCLYSKRVPIARNILKPKQILDRHSAHNPLADFQQLRLLLGAILLSNESGSPPFALCTADRAMGAFWCGMDFRNVSRNESGQMTVDFTISDTLFPDLSEDTRIALSSKIRSYHSAC